MKKVFLATLIVLFSVLVVGAKGIDGKWLASVESPQGKMEITYTFKVSGENLTGTMFMDMMDQKMEISKGKVDGNEFSFEMDMMGFVMKYKGRLEGDVIKMKMEMPEDFGQGGPEPEEMTLTKVE